VTVGSQGLGLGVVNTIPKPKASRGCGICHKQGCEHNTVDKREAGGKILLGRKAGMASQGFGKNWSQCRRTGHQRWMMPQDPRKWQTK
jgi:hypothetical protein